MSINTIQESFQAAGYAKTRIPFKGIRYLYEHEKNEELLKLNKAGT